MTSQNLCDGFEIRSQYYIFNDASARSNYKLIRIVSKTWNQLFIRWICARFIHDNNRPVNSYIYRTLPNLVYISSKLEKYEKKFRFAMFKFLLKFPMKLFSLPLFLLLYIICKRT